MINIFMDMDNDADFLITEHNWMYNDGIPHGQMGGAKIRKWSGPDSEKNFNKNKPAGWTKDSITYEYNQHGYRSIDFVENDNFTVASYGCSYVVGVGIKQEDTWAQKLCNKIEHHDDIPVNNFNFGIGASSMDMICRTMYKSLPIIKPDLVTILFTTPYRFELHDDDGYARQLSSGGTRKKIFEIIGNYNSCQNNFDKNFIAIDALMHNLNIPWMFSIWGSKKPALESHINFVEYFDKHYDGDDMARDLQHPGVLRNDRMAENFFQKYKQRD